LEFSRANNLKDERPRVGALGAALTPVFGAP